MHPASEVPDTSVRQIRFWLATWFGCGLVPFAPGTAGSLGALPLYVLLRPLGLDVVALAALMLTAVGVWAAQHVADRKGMHDPQIVVIDEVAGIFVTLLGARDDWRWMLAGFVLFRVLDVWKPWPARQAERIHPAGWGIVLDDVFAGAWGAIVLLLAQRLGIP
jgi:phosphatidylglycerophosphatase A